MSERSISEIETMVARGILNATGEAPDKAIVSEIARSLDIRAITLEQARRVKIERWMGEKIAGIDLYNHPNPHLRTQYRRVIDAGGVIYKIYIDGRLTVLQYHKPYVGGIEPIKEVEWEIIARSHADDIIRSMVNSEIVRRAVEMYREKRK